MSRRCYGCAASRTADCTAGRSIGFECRNLYTGELSTLPASTKNLDSYTREGSRKEHVFVTNLQEQEIATVSTRIRFSSVREMELHPLLTDAKRICPTFVIEHENSLNRLHARLRNHKFSIQKVNSRLPQKMLFVCSRHTISFLHLDPEIKSYSRLNSESLRLSEESVENNLILDNIKS